MAMLMAPAGPLWAGGDEVTAVVLRQWPPQYQTGEYGQPTGFAIDIFDRVAASAGLQVRYKVVDSWQEAFEALLHGRADVIPNLGITAERKEWFLFTAPVETFPIVIFVRHSTSNINSPADFKGRVVATIELNAGTRLAEQFIDFEHRIFKNINEGLLELLAGHVDALLYAQPVLIKLATEAGLEDRIKVVGPPLQEIKRAISIRKENRYLLDRLEPVVKQMVLSKKYEQIYARWYGRPKPFWTIQRVVVSMTGMIVVLALWHLIRVVQVNRRLQQSIAGQHHAESALKTSEEKYRLILENQSELTIKLNADGKILFSSPSFCDAFGISPEHAEGIRFISLVHHKDREQVQLAMQSLQVAPHACRHEGRVLTARGWQWFSWSNKALIGRHGQVKEIIAVGRDITERKEAETQLQESEERFRAIFEQAADAVVLLNMETLTISDFNTAAHQSLGYTHDAFSRINLTDLVVPGPKETNAEAVHRIMADSRLDPIEVMLRAQSGQVRYFLMKQRPLSVHDGKFLLGIWHDITQRKMFEDHLIQSQKMEAIGTLAGGVAHDFNNILSIIIGNAELAVQDQLDGHSLTPRLTEILTAGTRAKEVIRQLFSFSRKEPPNHSPVLLSPLVAESLRLLRATIPSTIEIRKQISDDGITLLADATQIHQVLINLCTNAAQAMGDDGGVIEIDVSTERLDLHTAQCFDIPKGTYARIRVKDTGCGIKPSLLERIFDPYFTTKKAHGGTGMGLSIVHSIVTRHNGVIDVDSRPGQGTVFNLLLPTTKKVPAAVEPCAEEICTGEERILLVDDEPSITLLVRQYLDRLGYQAEVFSSAQEALAKFKADPSSFDLVITDMTMPGMTGEALAKQILKIKPGTPIILCSGHYRQVGNIGADALGINIYLQKPYDMRSLAEAVRQALGDRINHFSK
jgi:PAS domain S-box-containing protein